MNETVQLAKANNVLVGAHPSLPDQQGWGRREMAMEPVCRSCISSVSHDAYGHSQDELASCFIYQVGALTGFLQLHGVRLNHVSQLRSHRQCYRDALTSSANVQIKPHGAVYGMTARDIALARAVVGVAKLYNVPFMGLAGTCHQTAAQELGVPFIAGPSFFLFFPPSILTFCTHRILYRVVRRSGLQR